MKNGSILQQSTQQVGLGLRDSQPGVAQPGHTAPVAPIQIHPLSGGISHVYIETLFEIYSLSGRNISENPRTALREFLSWCGRICGTRTKKRDDVLFYLLDKRCTTISMVVHDVDVSENATRRFFTELESIGLVERIIKIKKTGGTRPPNLWGLKNKYQEEHILKAIEEDRKRRLPIYSEVKRMEQLILDEYITPLQRKEITYSEILKLCKNLSKAKFYAQDLAQLLMVEWTRNGTIKVWR